MPSKIQNALGRNLRDNHPHLLSTSVTSSALGQAVIDSVKAYIEKGQTLNDGSELVDSIHSQNLRESALFSARSARLVYLAGKSLLLDSAARKGVVRTQIIEYGAVAEAILLDLIQSIGKNDKPPGVRPLKCKQGKVIAWSRQGLFTVRQHSATAMYHGWDFRWLIDEAERMGAIDSALKKRINRLRTSRNLVHPVIPTPQRYTDDLDSGRTARESVVALKDACLKFKKTHGLL